MTRPEAAPDAAASQDEIAAVTAICHPQIMVLTVPFHIYNNVFRPANNIFSNIHFNYLRTIFSFPKRPRSRNEPRQ